MGWGGRQNAGRLQYDVRRPDVASPLDTSVAELVGCGAVGWRAPTPVVPQLHPSASDHFTEHMRLLIDAHGREWRVFERAAGALSPFDGRSSLIFDTDGIVRRLWRYPSAWSSLPDAELLGLMDLLRRA